MEKVLITPRSFGKTAPQAFEMISDAGYEVIKNPYGKILTKEQMIERVADVTGIIVGVDPLDADVLAAAPKLRAIAKYGVGTDNIDLTYAQEHGIAVSITRGANSESVADYAFTLMLAAARNLVQFDRQCHEKNWTKATTHDVYGKTLGILGFGAIGKGVARRAVGFSMKVLAYDPFWDAQAAEKYGVSYAEPDKIYRSSDFISLHLPLNDGTKGMIDAAAFKRMKPTAILINTARGGLIDEQALAYALRGGQILAAGIDAFETEPPKDPELYQLDNLIMGPHCAASSFLASENMTIMSAKNLLSDLSVTS